MTLNEHEFKEWLFEELPYEHPEFYLALKSVLEYIKNTYNDKYNVGRANEKTLINTINISGELGTGYFVGNTLKYLQRYLTKGYEKSGDITDIKKSIHYLIFEVLDKQKLSFPKKENL